MELHTLIMTYWKTLDKAVNVQSKEEADRLLEELIAEAQKENALLNYAEARAIQLSNIGYFFGYLGPDQRAHAMEVWPEASHPIFGRFEHPPSPEQALAAGMALGAAMKEGTDIPAAIEAARKIIQKKHA